MAMEGHAGKEQREAGQRWTKQRQIEMNACGKSFAGRKAKTRVQLAGHDQWNNPLSCHGCSPQKLLRFNLKRKLQRKFQGHTATHTRG